MKAILQFAVLGYFAAAILVWKFRNPTANDATVWTEIIHVLKFEKLAKYQGR